MIVYISAGDWTWWAVLWTAIGWTVGVCLGLLCCIYVATLHENDLWFSNIKVRFSVCRYLTTLYRRGDVGLYIKYHVTT